MSKERAPASSLAAQLWHERCGQVIGAAMVHEVVEEGARSLRSARVTSVRVLPEPQVWDEHEVLECRRCRRPVPLGRARADAAEVLSGALIFTNRGPETRLDGGQVGTLRVAVSG